MTLRVGIWAAGVAACIVLIGRCIPTQPPRARLPVRADDVIVVCGERFHTGARVVLWSDAGGYNGYLERCFAEPGRVFPKRPAPGCETARRYGVRACLLDDAGNARPLSRRRKGRLIRQHVDQIVLHYDAAGTSRRCFAVLHDERGLSAHFLLDRDGVIYQTLDVAERARHAGRVNDRSVGIEMANVGAYDSVEELTAAYETLDLDGEVRGVGVTDWGDEPPIIGEVQGRRLYQFPFTEAQYESLAGLTRALRAALPRVSLRVPTDGRGGVWDRALSAEACERFSGVVGHYHVSAAKVDPGPAFDWSRLLQGGRSLPVAASDVGIGSR